MEPEGLSQEGALGEPLSKPEKLPTNVGSKQDEVILPCALQAFFTGQLMTCRKRKIVVIILVPSSEFRR